MEQCPSYDVIGRVSDYQIDPRSKLNSTITADDGDIVIVTQSEGRKVDPVRRRRQSFHHHRQTIVGDDSITVVSSDSSASQSPFPPSGGGGVASPIAEIPVAGGGPIAADTDDVIIVDAPIAGNPVGGVGVADVAGVAGVGATVSFILNDFNS